MRRLFSSPLDRFAPYFENPFFSAVLCVVCLFCSLFALSFGASPLVLRLCQSFKIVRRGFP